MEYCRVCLDVSLSKMYPLDGPIVNCDVSIKEMIKYCTSVEIDLCDGLPTSVCITCFRTVRIAYNFIHQFIETNRNLLEGKIKFEPNWKNSDSATTANESEPCLDVCKSESETTSKIIESVANNQEDDNFQNVEDYDSEHVVNKVFEGESTEYDEYEGQEEEATDDFQQNKVDTDVIHSEEDIDPDQQESVDFYQDKSFFNKREDVEYVKVEENSREENELIKYVGSKQNLQEYEIEYEIQLEEDDANVTTEETLEEGVVYETTDTPDQKIIKVIKKLGPPNKKQSTVMRRKIRTHYSCPVCPRTFFGSFENGMIPHLSKHEGESFLCNVCNTSDIYDTDSFLTHFMKIHRYQCPFCGKSCARKQNLCAHVKRHSGVTYSCPYDGCDKSFPAAWSLKKHEATHKDKVLYVCQECGMEFRTYDTYRYHQKKHMGRKFLCTHCGQAFMQSIHLKYHMWTHTGVKHFKCDLCPKSYTSVTQLKKHRRRHHPDVKEFSRYEELLENT